MRLHITSLLLLLLPGCAKEARPEKVENLVAPIGQSIGPLCKPDNDGARFLVRGYLRLPSTVKIEGDKLDLELYGRVDGQGDGDGRSLSIELREGKHIEFDTADVKSTFFAGRSGSKGRITGVRLRTRQGPAPIDGEVAVTLEQKVIQNVMTKATSGCTLSVVDLSQ